jgi:GNAT superfamily N-acetyltransferase
VIRVLDEGDVGAVTQVLGLARLHQGDGYYLVAWDGVTPIGHVHIAEHAPPDLQDLEVVVGARGRGTATALIEEASARCAATGHRRVRVTVSERNEVARSLYEKLGFEYPDEPPWRVHGTIVIRTGPIEVDDTLLGMERSR